MNKHSHSYLTAISPSLGHVRFTPESGHVQCKRPCLLWANSGHRALFNHLIGGIEEPIRNRQGECLSGLEIDHELELGWLLHRQIGRLFTFKDAIDIACRPPK